MLEPIVEGYIEGYLEWLREAFKIEKEKNVWNFSHFFMGGGWVRGNFHTFLFYA